MGYFPLGILEGMGFEAEALFSSKRIKINKRFSSFFTKPLPPEFMSNRQQNPTHGCVVTVMAPDTWL